VKADLKQQYENAKLGHRDNYGISRIENAQYRASKEYSGDELANYCGLPDPLGDDAEELRGYEERDEDGEEVGERMFGHEIGKEITLQTYFAAWSHGKFFDLALVEARPAPSRTTAKACRQRINALP
jgi:hypothetical protein